MKKLKILHDIMLEEIKAFIFICKKNKLKYFAIGGTCLGAIREKGFIPWDDDVDLLLLRDDFEKFVKIANDELKQYNDSNYKIYATFDNGIRSFHLAIDVDNEILGKTTVKIDILPFDKLPKSKIKQKIMRFKLLSYRAMIKQQRNTSNIFKKIYISLMQFVGKIKGYYRIKKAHDKIATKYNNHKNKYPYYISTVDAYNITLHKQYNVEWFTDNIIVPFENIEISVPESYHEYLIYEYGDYMERPPIEEQKPSHLDF